MKILVLQKNKELKYIYIFPYLIKFEKTEFIINSK